MYQLPANQKSRLSKPALASCTGVPRLGKSSKFWGWKKRATPRYCSKSILKILICRTSKLTRPPFLVCSLSESHYSLGEPYNQQLNLSLAPKPSPLRAFASPARLASEIYPSTQSISSYMNANRNSNRNIETKKQSNHLPHIIYIYICIYIYIYIYI